MATHGKQLRGKQRGQVSAFRRYGYYHDEFYHTGCIPKWAKDGARKLYERDIPFGMRCCKCNKQL